VIADEKKTILSVDSIVCDAELIYCK